MATTTALIDAIKAAGEDFEWYPTTEKMIDAVARDVKAQREVYYHHDRVDSILDIGAGDGRVLDRLCKLVDGAPTCYGIEKSDILRRAQPESVIPAGTDLFEQDLMSLPVEVAFSNPPYSEFEAWATRIIRTVYARHLYLVLPRRWKDSAAIAAALVARDAKARVIHEDTFEDAPRRARAVVDVIRVSLDHNTRGHKGDDPFDRWFDENISTFETPADVPEDRCESEKLARLHDLGSLDSLVAAFDEEYARMQANYTALFKLDAALFRELGVNKAAVRDGLKTRMKNLKNVYWEALFTHLDVITSRLITKTRTQFRDRITKQATVAFTYSNAYAVVEWALKFANTYFERQLVEVYRAISTPEGITNYVSNVRTWVKDGWRYNSEQFDHYALDYRIVVPGYSAIFDAEWGAFDYPGHLHKSRHETIADVLAVFGNLGFLSNDRDSRSRTWQSNVTQRFHLHDGRVLLEAKAFKNGNMHFRVLPDAIKALNIEAGRLLGWLRTPADAVSELKVTPAEAQRYFGSVHQLTASSVKLLLPEHVAEQGGVN